MFRWYRLLVVKMAAIGMAFYVLLLALFAWHYYRVRNQVYESSVNEARRESESIAESINFLLRDSKNKHASKSSFLEGELTEHSSGEKQILIIQSFSVEAQYGPGKRRSSRNHEEAASIVDGKLRFIENQQSFAFIIPIKARNECGNCHRTGGKLATRVKKGDILGAVVVSTSKSPMKESIAAFARESVVTLFAVTGLLAILVMVFEKYMAAPLRKLLRSIQKVTSEYAIEDDANDEKPDDGQETSWKSGYESASDDDGNMDNEPGDVAGGFRMVAERFEDSISRLEMRNTKLGLEVSSRTELLRKLKDRFESIIDSTQRIIYTTNTELVIESVNAEWDKQALSQNLGVKREDLLGKNLLEFISDDKREEYRTACKAIFETGGDLGYSEMYSTEFDVMLNGTKHYFRLTISPLKGSKGKIEGLVFVSTDISERKRAEQMLLVERNKLEAIMNGMGAGVNIISCDYHVTYANRIMESTFGHGIVGKRCHEVISKSMDKCIGCDIEKKGEDTSFEIQAANGQIYLVTRSSIREIDNKVSTIEVYKDITYLKEMEGKLRKLTITDNLTGLFNKRYFLVNLADEMARAQRQESTFALLFADIDKFKNYNDRYGHVEGDTCLASLGGLISESVRAHVDSGYRYGGEEFTMILPGADKEMAWQVAERIRENFGKYKFTPQRNGQVEEVRKTISIGIAIYDKKLDISSFIDKADSAMYTAKGAGGNRTIMA